MKLAPTVSMSMKIAEAKRMRAQIAKARALNAARVPSRQERRRAARKAA